MAIPRLTRSRRRRRSARPSSRTSSAAGKADDVEVVALDPLDEAGAEALDRVGAGALAPLLAARCSAAMSRGVSARKVTASSSRARAPPRRASAGRGPRRPRASGPESVSSIRSASPGAGGLAEDPAADDDDRVDAEHRPLAARRPSAPCRRVRVRARPGRRRPLLVARGDDVERDPQLLEDRAALRRDRGEEQRRSRRDAHARLRATQISSEGQRRAQSGRAASRTGAASRPRAPGSRRGARPRARCRGGAGSSRRSRGRS